MENMAEKNTTWLDACFIQKILRNSEKDESIEVSDINVDAATAKGDNYGSDMRRVAVTFSRVQDGRRIQENKSLIVKIVPEGEVSEKMMEGTGLFRTELSMMSVTLPQMNKILENECSTLLSPRCLNVQYEKPTHVVMEDLVPRGFRMAERHTGLDLDHCLLAIRHLAQFHAASIALIEKDPQAFTKYNKGIFHEDQPPELRQFVDSSVKILATEISKWPELTPRIKEKVLNLSEVLWDKTCEIALCRKDDFNVLNHGDFWLNNMLFRYDEQQKPIDHIFVDFQISQYASPAIDLLYFFGTSPTNEVRIDHRDVVLGEYHASLINTVVKLKCKTEIPTFNELQEILKNRAFYQVAASLTVLPIVALDKGDEINMEEFEKQNVEYINPAFHGKTYRKIMTTLLPWYDCMGFLDV